jgi:flagellar biosynthesis protein FlhF
MNIKRYRAATMRAALEQVKQELGADALVLETKEVRAGGFFGLGSKPLIELRVAANNAANNAANKTANKAAALPETGKRVRSWEEEERREEAAPAKSFSKPAASAVKGNGFAAFAARTYATESTSVGTEPPRTMPPQNVPAQRQTSLRTNAATQGVEIASTPPQVVRRSAPPPSVPEASVAPAPRPVAPPPAPAAIDPATGELARLRSEMRAEMRALGFSMNAMVARQVAYGDSTEGAQNQLRETFEADPEMFDSPYYEIYSVLTAAGLRPELARGAVRAGRMNGSQQLRNFETLARAGLVTTLPSIARFAADPLAPMIGSPDAPSAIALIGPTGVGKTTTIAKLAAQVVCRLRRRVVMVTLDTYRIAATEQLRIYAEIIGAGYHVAHSVRELDTLVRRHSGGATVLIDTAGRSPSDLSDEMELGSYLRECDDLLKMLVLPATTHPVDAHAAVRQFSLFGPNQLILTKMDETTRPGAAVSVAGDSGLPLAYLCSGQRVPEDLERATPLSFAARVVRASFAIQEF